MNFMKKHLKKHVEWNFRHFLFVEIIAVIVVIALWTIAFHYIEWWKMFDSLYFIFITMATIGYGDFVPLTVMGKILAMIYAVMWVPLFVYTSSMILDYRFKNYMNHYIKEIKKENQEHAESIVAHHEKVSKLWWFWKVFNWHAKDLKDAEITESYEVEINADVEDWVLEGNTKKK